MLNLFKEVWVGNELVATVALAVEVLRHESVALVFKVPHPTLNDIGIVTWHKDLIIRSGPDFNLIYILSIDEHLLER